MVARDPLLARVVDADAEQLAVVGFGQVEIVAHGRRHPFRSSAAVSRRRMASERLMTFSWPCVVFPPQRRPGPAPSIEGWGPVGTAWGPAAPQSTCPAALRARDTSAGQSPCRCQLVVVPFASRYQLLTLLLSDSTKKRPDKAGKAPSRA